MSPLDNRLGTGLTDPPGTQPSDPLSPSLQRLADQQTQLVAAIRSIGNAIAALTTATGANSSSAPWRDSARNPLTVSTGTGPVSVVAGAAVATLATYTVAAGRQAHLTVAWWALVDIALAAAQYGDLLVAVNGATVQNERFLAGSAAGTVLEFRFTDLDLVAGDVVVVQASLQAGAGNLKASAGIVGTAYDA